MSKSKESVDKSTQPPTKTIAFRVSTQLHGQIQEAAKAKGEDIGTYILTQIDKESELGQIMRVEAQRVWESTRDITKIVNKFLVNLNELKERMGMTYEEFQAIVAPAMEEFVEVKKQELQEKRKVRTKK